MKNGYLKNTTLHCKDYHKPKKPLNQNIDKYWQISKAFIFLGKGAGKIKNWVSKRGMKCLKSDLYMFPNPINYLKPNGSNL